MTVPGMGNERRLAMARDTVELPIWWVVVAAVGVVLPAALCLRRCVGAPAPLPPGLAGD